MGKEKTKSFLIPFTQTLKPIIKILGIKMIPKGDQLWQQLSELQSFQDLQKIETGIMDSENGPNTQGATQYLTAEQRSKINK